MRDTGWDCTKLEFTNRQVVNVDFLDLLHHLLHISFCQLLNGRLWQQVGEVDVVASISRLPNLSYQQFQTLLG